MAVGTVITIDLRSMGDMEGERISPTGPEPFFSWRTLPGSSTSVESLSQINLHENLPDLPPLQLGPPSFYQTKGIIFECAREMSLQPHVHMYALLLETAVTSEVVLPGIVRVQLRVSNLGLTVLSWHKECLNRGRRSPCLEIQVMKLYPQELEQFVRDDVGLDSFQALEDVLELGV